MGKRDTNIVDASLPLPPSPTELSQLLTKWLQTQMSKEAAPADPIHGNVFANQRISKKKGTAGCEKAAVQCCLEFFRLCTHSNAQYGTLDEFFISWARYAMNATDLCSAAGDVEAIQQQRQVHVQNGFKAYSLPTGSFKTYVNAVCRVASENGHVVVSTSHKQLPQFQMFMSDPIARFRQEKAHKAAARADTSVLSEPEFVKIMHEEATTPLHKQRLNILCIAWSTGLRADSLMKLTMNSFRDIRTDAGVDGMEIVIPNMKNLPADIEHCDASLFRQVIVPAENEKLCPVRAVQRQQLLVQEEGLGVAGDTSPLFHTSHLMSQKLPPGWHATWESGIVGFAL